MMEGRGRRSRAQVTEFELNELLNNSQTISNNGIYTIFIQLLLYKYCLPAEQASFTNRTNQIVYIRQSRLSK